MSEDQNPFASPRAGARSASPPVDAPPYASARGRGLVSAALLALCAMISLVAIFFTLAEIRLLQSIVDGAEISPSEADANDNRQGLVALVQLTAIIASVIAFCLWIHRAHRNLPSLGTLGLRFTPGWAVGWYFVPIMNLFRPYQVMREILQASHPASDGSRPDVWKLAPVTPLLALWWAAYIISGILGNISARLAWTEEAEPMIAGNYLGLADEALSIPAAFLVLRLVLGICRFQDEKADAADVSA